ncbi:50S ribosomal protein L29 [Ectothiorhodospira mobilis]|uniref:Large ribosomal subunit protein uL29 n=1 Tax=Ectothiorhodospira mobilis TaxID=195064 RepID=A0A1I4RFN6_ECTMO|nr:50S ribosomal protein L29 [Ectothiorhodospira mobilis]MBK1691386.1 50S ribosomal protein L29 [Ectothiorhodospira mobilis]MCG5536767.1 50S ribosomal protein L29 [Ectothiorhodospira mobilis]SFM50856.1 LSU ribosomal protein L29P [Ectothiorhodospira mobilis]
MKASELRDRNSEELKAELLELYREQFKMRMQNGTGQMPRPDRFGKVRKDIARIKTVLNERSRAGE